MKSTRLRNFKDNHMNSEDMKKNKINSEIELRKSKRIESLNKRRTLIENAPNSPPHKYGNKDIEVKDLNSAVKNLSNAHNLNNDLLYQSVLFIRKTLSRNEDPPIQQVINIGAVPLLVNLLSNTNSEIQFETLWALTNIASGNSNETEVVINSGALPNIVKLLKSQHIHISEQSLWAIGNIIGDSSKSREKVLETEFLPTLFDILNLDIPLTYLQNIAWCFSNICRNKEPLPNIEVVRASLPYIYRLLNHSNKECIVDACWAVSYLTDGPNERIEEVLKACPGITARLAQLLASPDNGLINPALKTLGNIVTGTNQHTQQVVESGAMELFGHLLTSPSRSLVKETAWLLSNIAAGDKTQIASLFTHNLIPPLCRVIVQGDYKCKREAGWVFANIGLSGYTEFLEALLQLKHDFIPALCLLLDRNTDLKLLHTLLLTLSSLLKVSDSLNQLEELVICIETHEGLDKLEDLQTHSNNEIYEKSCQIIETYFGVQEEEDIALNGAAESTNFDLQKSNAEGTPFISTPFNF